MADTFILAADDVTKPPYYRLDFYNVGRRNSATVGVRLNAINGAWDSHVHFAMPRRWAEERKGKIYYLTPIEDGYRMTEVQDG